MRVLTLFEYPMLNGGERSYLATLPVLADRGIEPVIAAPPRGELAEQVQQMGFPWIPLSVPGSNMSQAERRERIAALIAKVRPDLLHANSTAIARLSGPVSGWQSVPSVGHLRDMIRFSRQGVRDLARHVRLLAVSRATARWYQDQGLTGTPIEVLYNGVDLDQFRPVAGRAAASEVPLLLSVGQLTPRKGTDLLLRVVARLIRRGRKLRVAIVGVRHGEKQESRDFERQLRQVAQSAPLRGHVEFLGRRTDVASWLARCTVLVHLARQEPLGRVLLEASASGCCIVATDVGGTAEILPADSGQALIVPGPSAGADEQTVATAERAIERLLDDSKMRQSLGAAARARAESLFDVRCSAHHLADIYEQFSQ